MGHLFNSTVKEKMNGIDSNKGMRRPPLKFNTWTWVWPAVLVLLVLAKWLGLVSGAVALVAYFLLSRHTGLWQSVLFSAVLGWVAGVGMVFLIHGH